jgi:hypothetical protein
MLRRLEHGTRRGRRALGGYRQAVLVIRWFLDGTRLAQAALVLLRLEHRRALPARVAS